MTKKEWEFFNRDNEQKYLTSLFSKLDPIFFVLLGQPSTGKTALVRKVVSEVGSDNKQFDALFLNLRGTEISSRDSLYKYLRDCSISAGPFWKGFGEQLTGILKVELDVKQIGGFEINARESTTIDVQTQLSDLIKLIPSSDRRGIIVVDEANRLKGLAAADKKESLIDLFVVPNYSC